MTNFYSTVIRNSKAFRSDAVCKDVMLLEPGTRAAVLALMAEAKAAGYDLRLLETYRSQTRQSALYVQRATQLRTVGCHGYGVAADFGLFIKGVYQTKNGPYVFLKDLARKHGLISGQDWGHAKATGFVDSGHVQRVPVWRQPELFNGSFYPQENYDPYADSAAHGHHDVVGLREDRGPTLEEWRAAGYMGPYPPHGYEPRKSPANPEGKPMPAVAVDPRSGWVAGLS